MAAEVIDLMLNLSLLFAVLIAPSQESDIALELRNRDRERKLIKKVDESIARIDSGDYGFCDSCGVEIGLKRMEARPTATMCIDCKTLEEHREKQIGK